MKYRLIRIYTTEDARFGGLSLWKAIVQFVGELKIAARCSVFSGMAGSFENGDLCLPTIEVLSFNRPLQIDIVLPAAEMPFVLPEIEAMVEEGVVAVDNLPVVAHRTKKAILPKHLRIRDAMTPNPRFIHSTDPLAEAVKLLLSEKFNGLPVVDHAKKPVGIITQGDLKKKADLPLRLGLLAEFQARELEEYYQTLANRQVREVMTQPVTCLKADENLLTAVDLMLARNLKRIPILDDDGRLSGILARSDIFRTIARESPNWRHLAERNVKVTGLCQVKDIMTRDQATVLPDCPLGEVLRLMVNENLQRIPVTDKDGRFLGLVSDKDLLGAFSDQKPGLWAFLASRLSFLQVGREYREILERSGKKTAADLMKSDLITIGEDLEINEAIRLMRKHFLKRLPVVDAAGKFKGLISRDSLLRVAVRQDA
ncbi:MAG: CBS domain-containing protein [Candidatus Riflebacteria bacterium]|nr:CBS domain-containing protein [Candidatus Riflebacteria bacterium]